MRYLAQLLLLLKIIELSSQPNVDIDLI